MLHGIDVSNLQGNVDWSTHKSLAFAFAKATEGIGFRDALFPHNWQGMKSNGIVRGAYDFAHPANDPVAEADYFISYVRSQGLGAGDMLALDLEVTDGLRPAAVASYATRWCQRVSTHTNIKPIVYTFLSFAQAGNCDGLGGYPLWIAEPSALPGQPAVPAPWHTWAFHQYANTPVDQDVLNGTAAELAALGMPAGGSKEETVQRLCVLGLGGGAPPAVIPANSDTAVSYNVTYLDPDKLHAADGFSIVPKTARDYHLWARCTIQGLQAGDQVSLQFARYGIGNGLLANEIHREDRIGDGNPIAHSLYCFDLLDTMHGVRFSIINRNSYPVTVTASQFRLAI
jgi:lysozyme